MRQQWIVYCRAACEIRVGPNGLQTRPHSTVTQNSSPPHSVSLINGLFKKSKDSVIAAPKGFIRGMQNNMGNNNLNEYSPFAIAFVFMLAVPHSQHVQSSVNSFSSFICGNTSRRSSREFRTQEADTKWNRLTLFLLFSHYLNSKLIDQRLIVWHNRIDCWLKRNFNWPIFVGAAVCIYFVYFASVFCL